MVQENGNGRNLSAVTFCHLSNERCEQEPDGEVVSRKGREWVLTFLAENGVVIAGYIANRGANLFAMSWHPEGMEGYAAWPYPEEESHVLPRIMQPMCNRQIDYSEKALEALKYTVMLAIDTHRETGNGRAG